MSAAVGFLVVVTTVGCEEEANRLADQLVVRRHAACVNVVKVHRSVYRWQGRVFDDNEYLLIIKTKTDEYSEVEATIRELSSYELPEVLAFNVARGEAKFLEWVTAGLDKTAEYEDDIEPR